jgi:hypothetical protein
LTGTFGRLTNSIAQRFFDGLIDEVAIYDGALSQAQLQAHIAAASAFNVGDVQRTPALAVNFTGETPVAAVEPGFQTFSRPDATSGTQSQSFASPFAATGTDITVTVDGADAFRNRNNMSGPDGNMGESFVFGNDTLTLTLSNLAAGTYELTTYHHDASFQQSDFNVLLTDAANTDALVASNVLSSTGTLPADIALVNIDIIADGVGDVILQFIEPGLTDVNIIPLSGFELTQVSAAAVPEPASIGIWGLLSFGAAVGVWARRRKARRPGPAIRPPCSLHTDGALK